MAAITHHKLTGELRPGAPTGPIALPDIKTHAPGGKPDAESGSRHGADDGGAEAPARAVLPGDTARPGATEASPQELAPPPTPAIVAQALRVTDAVADVRGIRARRGWVSDAELRRAGTEAIDQVTDEAPLAPEGREDAISLLIRGLIDILAADEDDARLTGLDEIEAGDRDADGELVGYERYQAA